MAETETMRLGIGEHPDWRFWPEKGRYPVIDGECWMVCTDGCYFVNLDRPGMLIVAERTCSVCGCRLHPGRSPLLPRRDRCPAHQKGMATRTGPRQERGERLPEDVDDEEEDDWEDDEEEEDDEEPDDEEGDENDDIEG